MLQFIKNKVGVTMLQFIKNKFENGFYCLLYMAVKTYYNGMNCVDKILYFGSQVPYFMAYCIYTFDTKFHEFIEAIVYFVSNFWSCISLGWKLSEKFIETFKDQVDWQFIETFKDQVDWRHISQYQELSESFIEKFQDKVHWSYISQYQTLSEEFIEKFQDKVRWSYISEYQKLSEEFIEKFQDKVSWYYITTHQKLSEEFIEKNWPKIEILYVAMCQKLSEEFIKKIKDNADNFPIYKDCQSAFWKYIYTYQKLSPQFRDNLKVKIGKDVYFSIENNWLYKDDNFKLTYIKEHTDYKVIDDKYIIAYKGIRSNNYSKYNFQHKYEIGKIYEDHCDCNADAKNSFGLSAWTLQEAKKYCNQKIIKVKIAISDIGCIVQLENKIRCFRFEVLEEVK